MTARIYKPARNAMQSGKGKGDVWLLAIGTVHRLRAFRKGAFPHPGHSRW